MRVVYISRLLIVLMMKYRQIIEMNEPGKFYRTKFDLICLKDRIEMIDLWLMTILKEPMSKSTTSKKREERE